MLANCPDCHWEEVVPFARCLFLHRFFSMGFDKRMQRMDPGTWPVMCLEQTSHRRKTSQWIIPIDFHAFDPNFWGTDQAPICCEEEIRSRPSTLANSALCDNRSLVDSVDSVPYGYGSIPINTIFSGMNIHLPAILMFTRGTIGFDPSPYDAASWPLKPLFSKQKSHILDDFGIIFRTQLVKYLISFRSTLANGRSTGTRNKKSNGLSMFKTTFSLWKLRQNGMQFHAPVVDKANGLCIFNIYICRSHYSMYQPH